VTKVIPFGISFWEPELTFLPKIHIPL